MAINLTKGSRINLAKEAPSLTRLRVGLGWAPNSTDTGHDFDLDVTAFGLTLDANGDPKLAGRKTDPGPMFDWLRLARATSLPCILPSLR